MSTDASAHGSPHRRLVWQITYFIDLDDDDIETIGGTETDAEEAADYFPDVLDWDVADEDFWFEDTPVTAGRDTAPFRSGAS